MPDANPSRAMVEAALERVQAWPGLARSPQLARFLKYIVEARLDGNDAGIKAYAIAVDVFGRPQSFDPQTDPIVRVQARRLRSALDEYYAGEGAEEAVRFYLPVGRYVPEFVAPGMSSVNESLESREIPRSSEVQAASIALRPRRSLFSQIDDIVLLVLLVGVALGVALVMTQVMAPRPVRLAVPQPPRVAVAEFTSVGDANGATVAGLAVELVTDLNLFSLLDAVYLPRLEPGIEPTDGAPYELSGIARAEAGIVHVAANLRRTASDTSVWTMSQDLPADGLVDHLDDLSRGFADQLGSYAGPLHAEALQWLANTPDISGNETEYLCSLLYWMHRTTPDPALTERARLCVNNLLAKEPKSALGLSMQGGLLVEQIYRRSPLSRDPEPVAQAERLLREALGLFPTSSSIWREYGVFLAVVGRPGEAEAAFSSALQLNPADLDSVASYGVLLSQMGKSDRGSQFANDAIARSITPPFWYHRATAINALRTGDNARALAEAELLAVGDSELGSVISTVAAYRLADEGVLNKSIAQMLEVARFRRFGIVPVLRQRLLDDDLRASVAQVLAQAGIDPAALNGPF